MNNKKLLFLIPMIATALAGCGEKEEEHTLKYVEGTAATCLEAGVVSHYHCDHCSKNFADSEAKEELTNLVLPALGHEMTHHELVEATCTETGTKEHYTCSHESGVYYKDEEGSEKFASPDELVLPSGNHDYVIEISGDYKTKYEAFQSFDKTGLEVTLKCSACDFSKVLTESEYTIAYQSQGSDYFKYGDTKVAVSAVLEGVFAQKEITGLEVSKKSIPIPEAAENSFTYDGTSKTLELPTSEFYSISDNVATNAGSHFAKVSLTFPDSCVWSNGKSEDQFISFTIGKAANVIEGVAKSYETYCGTDIDLSGVTSTSGTLKTSYFTEIDCQNEVLLKDLSEGDYFVKISAGNDNYVDAYQVRPISVSHNITHHNEKKATLFEEGNIEYWGCDGCGIAYSDEGLQHLVNDVKISANGTVVSESAMCSNGISYEPVTMDPPGKFKKVNKVSLDGDRIKDCKYYSNVLVNSFKQLVFAVKCGDEGLYVDGSANAVYDNSWVVITVEPLGDDNYHVSFEDEFGVKFHEISFEWNVNVDTGYVIGGLNSIMFKAEVYPVKSTTEFYVTELIGEKITQGDLIENCVVKNSATKQDAEAPLGFKDVFKTSVNGERNDANSFSNIDLTPYEYVTFGLMTKEGYLLTDGWASYADSSKWVIVTIESLGNYNYRVTYKGVSSPNTGVYVEEFMWPEASCGERGVLNSVLWKANAYCDRKTDEFYVTELRGELLSRDIEGTIIDDSVYSANGVVYSTLTETAPKGFEKVNKLDSATYTDYVHGQFYSNAVLTNYNYITFAMKVNGVINVSEYGTITGNGEWLYFELCKDIEYVGSDWAVLESVYTVSITREDGTIIWFGRNFDSYKGAESGVYTNFALNTILYGNSLTIYPEKTEGSALEVFITELRGVELN